MPEWDTAAVAAEGLAQQRRSCDTPVLSSRLVVVLRRLPSTLERTNESDQGEFVVWSIDDNHGFEDELDYLRSRKKDDSYNFSYSFEYIANNRGNDEYDVDTATMNVRVEWNDSEAGYAASYDVPDMHKINPFQGNSDASGFYEHDVYWRVIADLEALGIGNDLRTF